MGPGREYHFNLQVSKKNRAAFPERYGKKGQASRAVLEGRIRSAFEPLGGSIQTLSIGRKTIDMVWKSDAGQASLLAQISVLLSGGKPADGILLLELFLSAQPQDPALLYALGNAYSDQNELERAIELFSNLLEIAPGHTNARVGKGAALLKAGNVQAGIKELEIAIRQDPENLWAHRNLGAGLMLLNRYSEAAANLRLARELDPQDQQAWFEYGKALEKMGEIEQASMAYSKVIEIDEFSVVADQARARRTELAGKPSHIDPPAGN